MTELQHIEKPLQDHVVGGCDGNLAVPRLEETVRGHQRVVIAGAGRQLSGGEIFRRQIGHHADRAIHHGAFHMLSRSIEIARAQRAHNAECTVEAGHQIGDRLRDAHRLGAFRTVHAHQPAHGLSDEIEGGAVHIGAGRAIAVYIGGHQPRIERLQPRLAKTHLRHHAGAEIVDEDVGIRNQPLQHRAAARAIEIDDDRLLVAVEACIIGGEPVAQRALFADRVALGGFHLDHLRPHVAQHHGAERAGKNPRQINDANAFERRFFLGHILSHWRSQRCPCWRSAAAAPPSSPGREACAR